MECIEITQQDLDERDEYCSKERFKELVKERMKTQAMGFKEAVESLCEEDVILFLVHQLGMKPWAWQFIVLRDYVEGYRDQEICTSRQIGKSKMVVSPILLWRCWYNIGWKSKETVKNKGKTTTEGVTSATEDQSTMINGEIREWIWQGDEYMAETYLDKSGKPIFGKKYFSEKVDWKKTTIYKITFKKALGGSVTPPSIKSVPPTDKIRGSTYTGFVFDEKAYIDDNIITDVAEPACGALSTSNIGVSTPNKKAGEFYIQIDPDELFEHTDRKRYMFDLDCIKLDDEEYYNHVIKKYVEPKLAKGQINAVRREYYCDFTSSNDTYFDMDKVEDSFVDTLEPVKEYKGGVSLGIDIGGKTKSHTVLTITTEPDYQEVSKRIACWRYPIKQDVNIIEDIEREIFPNFNVRHIVIDYCAASRLLYEQMINRGWNVTQFEFSKQSKSEYYERFRTRVSTQKLITYPDSELKNEFVSFTDDMKPMKGATDDMLDSWMLASYPYLKGGMSFTVKVLGGSKNTPEDNDRMLQEQLDAYNKRANEFQGLGGAI
jgi:hypothetical protein